MSRIGKKTILLPAGVSVAVQGRKVIVSGPKGTLEREVRPEVEVLTSPGEVSVKAVRASGKTPAYWGLTRALVSRMVEGVSAGFEKKLELEGLGYRAALEGETLVLGVGFSHPVRIPAPPGITFAVEKNTITVSGPDAELVGDTAARIRHVRPPEPYQGKGIRYAGEVIRKKAGKRAAAAGA